MTIPSPVIAAAAFHQQAGRPRPGWHLLPRLLYSGSDLTVRLGAAGWPQGEDRPGDRPGLARQASQAGLIWSTLTPLLSLPETPLLCQRAPLSQAAGRLPPRLTCRQWACLLGRQATGRLIPSHPLGEKPGPILEEKPRKKALEGKASYTCSSRKENFILQSPKEGRRDKFGDFPCRCCV